MFKSESQTIILLISIVLDLLESNASCLLGEDMRHFVLHLRLHAVIQKKILTISHK